MTLFQKSEGSREFVDLLSDLTLLGLVQMHLSAAIVTISELQLPIQKELKDLTEALTLMIEGDQSEWQKASNLVLKEILTRSGFLGDIDDEAKS